jgi:alpha,alpha-trehalase
MGAVALLATVVCCGCARPIPSGSHPETVNQRATGGAISPDPWRPVRDYIKRGWSRLSRSHADLAAAAIDAKIPHQKTAAWVVYFPATEDGAALRTSLRASLGAQAFGRIDLRPLPDPPAPILEHGLLYLPKPYVVPGGRFNEMYGWDSYFIALGLLRDGEVTRAKDLADDLVYEVVHYGHVLNANRSYYLTRSQPPFLSQTIRAVYAHTHDRDWLATVLPAVDISHRFWTSGPHQAGSTGLSRYYDFGAGPAPEVLYGERDDSGRTHYDRVREYFRTHPSDAPSSGRLYVRAEDRLTDQFYKGDRSMRESGFDPSGRFGHFGADVIDYAPVCLNTLLFQLEQDAAYFNTELGRAAAADDWAAQAERRRRLIDDYLWDDQAGLYFDYDFQTGRRRPYPYATTFFPLWTHASSSAQAARVRANLPLFERPGGIVTSTTVTGNQWDAPFGWAPLQLAAVRGLEAYGYRDDAGHIARAWMGVVLKEFQQNGTLVEKYDVVRRESEVEGEIHFGYSANQVGFGWTNGVLLELLDAPPVPHP